MLRHVNWKKVSKDLEFMMDVNKDGKVDEKDMESLLVHIPSGIKMRPS